MKLHVLGSGTVCPSLRRASSGYLLEVQDELIWFDMGAGTLRRFLEYGHSIEKVHRLFLTHVHPDHTSDLVPFLFAANYAPGFWPEGRQLDIYGPPGLWHFLTHLGAAWSWVEPKSYERHVHELEDGHKVTLGHCQITAHRVVHGELNALSYRVEAEDKTFCYSGDSGVCDNLVKSAHEADLFLCECAIPMAFPAKPDIHLTSVQAGQIATKARAKRVVVTHLYPQADEVDLLAEIRPEYEGPLEKAEDGASFQV